MRPLAVAIGLLAGLTAAPVAAQQGLPFDLKKLAPHRDTMVVLVNNQPRGGSVLELARAGDSLVIHERTVIGATMRQETTVDLSKRGEVRKVSQSGMVRDVQGGIEIQYTGDHVTGQVQAVTPGGPDQFAVDTTVPPGTIDDNVLQALLPSLPWAKDAGWNFPMYSAGTNSVADMTLYVVGEETAMVPAGAFDAYRARLSGGAATVEFLILKRAPHTVLKVEMSGAPLKFELVSGGGL